MKPLAIEAETSRAELSLDEEHGALAQHRLDFELFDRSLLAAAREFLARPGKAFRARMIEGSYALAGGVKGRLPRACLEAVELLHGGSLIIDDIQDGSQVRRGAPTLHRLIGVPKALNTGNWLYFVALSRLSALDLPDAESAALSRAAHRCLMRCHEGQALDLGISIGELKTSEIDAVVRTISSLKTGALMGFAARLGADVARAPETQRAALSAFGEKVGIALQMLDDLGSFCAEERRPKALEDLAGARVNWVWAWARESLDEVTFRKLLRSLARRQEHDSLCEELARASEPLGRVRAGAAIREALLELERAFAASEPLDAMRAELTRLEKSYG